MINSREVQCPAASSPLPGPVDADASGAPVEQAPSRSPPPRQAGRPYRRSSSPAVIALRCSRASIVERLELLAVPADFAMGKSTRTSSLAPRRAATGGRRAALTAESGRAACSRAPASTGTLAHYGCWRWKAPTQWGHIRACGAHCRPVSDSCSRRRLISGSSAARTQIAKTGRLVLGPIRRGGGWRTPA